MIPVIIGLSGPDLAEEEAELLTRFRPAGVVLFARNVADPLQLRRLTDRVRAASPTTLVLVDQEGGRVARLRPPQWYAHPSAGQIGGLFQRDPAAGRRAAWLSGVLIGSECAMAGIAVVCAPVLDLRLAGAAEVIGDRAFGSDPKPVAELGRAMAEGLLAGGVQPVGKHAPGHGRALANSHVSLPRVETETLADDFFPFIVNAALPWMMTAHVVYAAIDSERPATLSAEVIGRIIRGVIGFAGVLVSDDLGMGAVAGDPVARAGEALAAGCDLVLFGNGDVAANRALLAACPPAGGVVLARLERARGLAAEAKRSLDVAALAAERAVLLAP